MKKAQEIILPHTEEKLRLFNQYLKRYLRILALSPFVDTINIFDLFCGTGIYEDGKKGSPIVAFESIKNMHYFFIEKKWKLKQINLIVNDADELKIENVKNYLNERNKPNICNINYGNYDARVAFDKVIHNIQNQRTKSKNLLFLDPYGYKEIHKADIYELLKKRNSEIILFLPISFMHRFTGIAFEDFGNANYSKLNEFIFEFFDKDHPIRKGERMNVKDYIKFIEDTLTFSFEYYTASFYLQRDKSNYFAVFFITPNIYGLEKFLDVVWEIDQEEGSGYRGDKTLHLFKDSEFESSLIKFIKENHPDNISLYKYILCTLRRRVKQANDLLKKLRKNEILKVLEIGSNKINKKGFYLTYDNYIKDAKLVKFIIDQ